MVNTLLYGGYLARDIELRYSQGGTPVAKSSLASTYRYKSQSGEQKEEVCFLEFNMFGRSAEVANQYLKKGSKVLLEGRLVLEQWTAQDGSSRSRHSLRVEEMKMLDSKGSNEGSSYGNNSYNQVPKEQYNEPSYNPNQGAGRVAQSRVEQNIPEIDIDDEIPF